jgi:hypothetical protein
MSTAPLQLALAQMSSYGAGRIAGRIFIVALIVYALYRLKRWGRGE